jgi:hypothetical protein
MASVPAATILATELQLFIGFGGPYFSPRGFFQGGILKLL